MAASTAGIAPEPEPDDVEGAAAEKPPRKRRERKPTLAGALKQASKAGAKVRGATMAADGSVSLQFGEAEPSEASNPWDAEIERLTKQ